MKPGGSVQSYLETLLTRVLGTTGGLNSLHKTTEYPQLAKHPARRPLGEMDIPKGLTTTTNCIRSAPQTTRNPQKSNLDAT